MKTIVLLAAILTLWPMPAQTGTMAYWRFEEGAPNEYVQVLPRVTDISGNGNNLSAWSEGGGAGYVYRTDVSLDITPQSGDPNHFSVQNTGAWPCMFTPYWDPMITAAPAAFTIEASFKPETGGYRTIVGRDSRGAVTGNNDLAALYFQIVPGDAVAVRFGDVSGVWHEAISAPGLIAGFYFPDDPHGLTGHWYHMAAVSDGNVLSLYLDSGDGNGYLQVAQTDMTGSSPNTALTPGTGAGDDWVAGSWSVGRGLYAGQHVDRAYGFIDEVRISDSALSTDQFLLASLPASVMIQGLGAGSVHTTTPDMNCTGGTCTKKYYLNTNTSFTPIPAGHSIFGGWSGDCAGVSGDCTLLMDRSRTVLATFDINPAEAVWVDPGTSYYGAIYSAYQGAAESGSKIKACRIKFTGSLTFDLRKTVALMGGYNSDYSLNDGYTTVVGKVTIKSGKVAFNNMVIR